MLSSLEILTTLRDLIDAHQLWPEVEQYGKCDRSWLEDMIYQIEHKEVQVRVAPEQHVMACVYPTTTLTTTNLHALCFGAAIDEYALVNGEPVLPAPTTWQRNLDRHDVPYQLSTYAVPQKVAAVQLVLDPEAWCSVGMNSGNYYRADAPEIQLIINTAFRAGGWIGASALSRFADLNYIDSCDHLCNDATLLLRWFSRVDPLTPWERLGCLCQLTSGHLLKAGKFRGDH
jgi:hypothetical protein